MPTVLKSGVSGCTGSDKYCSSSFKIGSSTPLAGGVTAAQAPNTKLDILNDFFCEDGVVLVSADGVGTPPGLSFGA